jgi:hypothetical protein
MNKLCLLTIHNAVLEQQAYRNLCYAKLPSFISHEVARVVLPNIINSLSIEQAP